MTDAFAAAAEKANASTSAPVATEDSYDDGPSGLFGGQKLPSLFNKFVTAGTVRTGIITKAPSKRQSSNVAGELKFWDEAAKKVVTSDTGKPMYDIVIVVQTDYRYTEQEIADRNLDAADVADDEGVRGIFASGDLKKEISRAARAAGIRSDAGMIGKKITVDRGRKVTIEGGKTKWIEPKVTIENVSVA